VVGAERPREARDIPSAWSYSGARVVPVLKPENIFASMITNWVASRSEVQARTAAPADLWPITPSACVTDSASLSPRLRAANGV